MNEERMKILQMIQDGVVTASEGAELLAAIDVSAKKSGEAKLVKNAPFKMLKVKVLSSDGDKVNVQIPTNFLKVAKLGKLANNIKINGVDQDFITNAIDIDEILEMIESGMLGKIVDVESADGDIVQVYIE